MKRQKTIFDRPAGQSDANPLDALFAHALALHRRGELAVAERLCRDILSQEARHADATQLLGLLCYTTDRLDEALLWLNRAIHCKPGFAVALNNRGVVLEALARDTEALASYDEALRCNPRYADAWNNRGVVLNRLGKFEDALFSYDQAAMLTIPSADLINNRAAVLQDLHRFDEALSGYAAAIALQPDFADAHWNESRCRLLLGDYEGGWGKYEWRWKRAKFTSLRRSFSGERWTGLADIRGKRLLVHAEQGLGDSLQFVRYIPMLAARGARVILEAQAALVPLLSGYPGVERLVAQGDELPQFDFHCPLLSLPLAFGTRLQSIPASMPYLQADPEKVAKWALRLGDRSKLRVGLTWTGNPKQQDNHLRSIPLARLVGLGGEGVELVSLQKELRNDEEADLVCRGLIRHFGDELEDFSDTAALIANVDLVISVCTSVAHLAGAMAKPLWMLLQYAHDWRWLLNRTDSPWYPTARLYRQHSPGDWESVILRVQSDLVRLERAGGPR